MRELDTKVEELIEKYIYTIPIFVKSVGNNFLATLLTIKCTIKSVFFFFTPSSIMIEKTLNYHWVFII